MSPQALAEPQKAGPHATTGKPEFAVRENLYRAFFFGRTAKRIFTVRFLHSARRKKTLGKKNVCRAFFPQRTAKK
jgi:hypothetical protein